MPTDNYLKVHRAQRPSIELFFDSHEPVSVAGAHRAARELASSLTEIAQAHSDAASAEAKRTPEIVPTTAIVVWTHGVRGLGDLHCIGGCELCAPKPELAIVEAEEDLDDPVPVEVS